MGQTAIERWGGGQAEGASSSPCSHAFTSLLGLPISKQPREVRCEISASQLPRSYDHSGAYTVGSDDCSSAHRNWKRVSTRKGSRRHHKHRAHGTHTALLQRLVAHNRVSDSDWVKAKENSTLLQFLVLRSRTLRKNTVFNSRFLWAPASRQRALLPALGHDAHERMHRRQKLLRVAHH